MAIIIILLGAAIPLQTARDPGPAHHAIRVSGTHFLLDGKPFAYTGVSFFNAVYNPTFNHTARERGEWLAKFDRYGINVLRIWAQWDNTRGLADTGPDCTLYHADGCVRQEHLATLKAIVTDAAAHSMVIELCLFANESRRDGKMLAPEAADRAVVTLARELRPLRNLTFQIWNEHSERTLEMLRVIKREDRDRLITSAPGFAGVLGSDEENRALDYLTPHTSRQSQGKPWQLAPREIAGLLARFGKPVVDDEPARTGTPKYGGPSAPTSPFDHIVQIWEVWKVGGHVNYHHDMFQTGYGSAAVPPSGIPDPEFSPYHRQVFEFLRLRERYQPTAENVQKPAS